MKQNILKLLHSIALGVYESFMTGVIFLYIQNNFITPVWHVTIFPNFKTAVFTGVLLVVSISWHIVPHIDWETSEEDKKKEYTMRWGVPIFALIIIYSLCKIFALLP